MSDIIGPAAAKAALTELLASIRASLQAAGPAGSAGYGQAVDKAQNDLDAFANSTHAADAADMDEVAAVRVVDTVARDLLLDLSLAEMEGNLEKIHEGAGRLAALGGQLMAEADHNQASADSIGLKPVKTAIDTLTAAVNSVKALKANLSAENPDQAKVAAEIEKLVAQFEALKDAAEKLG